MQPDLNKDAIVQYQREADRYIQNAVKAYYKDQEQVHRIPLQWWNRKITKIKVKKNWEED